MRWIRPQFCAGLQPLDGDSPKRLLELQVHKSGHEQQNEKKRQSRRDQEASRTLYRDLFDLAPIAYCSLDKEGRIQQANFSAATMLGVSREALVQQSIRRFIAMEEQAAFDHYCQQLALTKELRRCDLRMIKSDRTTFWARLSWLRGSIGDIDNHVYRITLADISESKCQEEALREKEEFFHLIAENLSDFIAVLDTQGRRLYNSPSYQQFFGNTNDLQGTDSFAEIHPDDRQRVKNVFMETVQSGQGSLIEYRFVLADGSIRDMESRGSVIKNQDGQVVRVVVVSHDITQRKQLQEQVQRMAFHDPLTQLPNRRLFCDRLNQAMVANTRSACYGTLLFIDLDNFKPLNDVYGHDVGDLLLIEVANRLRRCLREMDTVVRFGGDEFVVLLGQLDMDKTESSAQTVNIAEKLRAALAEPYLLNISQTGESDSISYRCTASIGVALFNHLDATQDEILKQADTAMYQAKQAGGNQVRFFASDSSQGLC